jgi:hypothetical protein
MSTDMWPLLEQSACLLKVLAWVRVFIIAFLGLILDRCVCVGKNRTYRDARLMLLMCEENLLFMLHT